MDNRYTGTDPLFVAMQATIDAAPARLREPAATTGATRKRCRTWYRVNGRFVSEDTYRTTLEDMASAKECYDTEVFPAVLDGTYDGPELCVLSTGYAEVYSDGDVVQYGRVLWNVSDD